MTDSVEQRRNMVESQVRPSDVTDRRIIAAMQAVPREAFVPARLAGLAYMDRELPLDEGRHARAAGRALMEPRTLAKLLQLAAIESGERVLVIGASTGYAAALAAQLGAEVVALESDPRLAERARAALDGAGGASVEVITGNLAAGHAAAAPFDVILLDGSVPELPMALGDQLADGGRMAGIEAVASGSAGHAVLVLKSHGTLARRVAFDAAAPALPGFAAKPEFVF